MKKYLNLSLIAVLCVSTVACSTLKFPGVYRVRIMQGNYIEQEMIDKLQVGMTQDQVRFVMGTPLIQDTFTPDRWDYYINIRRGDKLIREHHFQVFFDETGQLAGWTGDYEKSTLTKDETNAEALDQTEREESAKF